MGPNPFVVARSDAPDGVTRIAVAGELELSTVPILQQELERVEREAAPPILLDLRDLRVIDPSGLRLFLQAHHRAEEEGRSDDGAGVAPTTRTLFEITGAQAILAGADAAELLDAFAEEARGRLDAAPA